MVGRRALRIQRGNPTPRITSKGMKSLIDWAYDTDRVSLSRDEQAILAKMDQDLTFIKMMAESIGADVAGTEDREEIKQRTRKRLQALEMFARSYSP